MRSTMLESKKIVKINNKGICTIEGKEFPAIGFGTYPLKGNACFNALLKAAEYGYRIIDTATIYSNFIPIGQALKKLGRENFYVISKAWHDSQNHELLVKDIEKSLRELQTDYLDAYLLHWPNHKVPIEESLSTMQQLKDSGVIRHIGVSNFTVNHLKRALEYNISITWLQVEMNPLFYDVHLLKFCEENTIAVQGWSPLADGKVMEDPFLNKLSIKYQKSPAQIALKWLVQNNCLPLAQSNNENHILQNFEAIDFSLSQKEINHINEKAKLGHRTRITKDFDLGFIDEFDFSYEECWPKE